MTLGPISPSLASDTVSLGNLIKLIVFQWFYLPSGNPITQAYEKRGASESFF